MPLPDFIIIGAAKSGTTSLCSDIARHPGIYMCDPKEPEYFVNDDKYDKGLLWYESLFHHASSEQLIGEASTMYSNCTQYPSCMQRMNDLLPNAKLIYMVRDPVERAYSYWLQLIKNQDNFGGNRDIPRVFDAAIAVHNPIVSIGDYKLQIEHILKYYSSTQLHVIVFEEYISCRKIILSKLFNFLEIENADIPNSDPVWKNKSVNHFSSRARTNLANKINKYAVLRKSKSFFPIPVRRCVLTLASKIIYQNKYLPEPMSDSSRIELETKFAHVRPWLESYLGRSIDRWSV